MRYADAWRERERLRNNLLRWWIGGPIVFLLLTAVGAVVLGLLTTPSTQERGLDGLFAVVGVGWVTGFLFWGFQLFHGFACPRCRRPFHLTGLQGDPWTARCLNCGLHKDAVEPFSERGGVAPIQLPLFIRGKELRVFACVGDAEQHLMHPDVWADEGFDSAGLRLQFQQWGRRSTFGGWTSERVLLDQGEAQPTGQARLKELLGAQLEARGASREWLGRASLDELVAEAARVLEAPRPGGYG